jgi:hypothetical protein
VKVPILWETGVANLFLHLEGLACSWPEHDEGYSDGKDNNTGKSVPGHKAG